MDAKRKESIMERLYADRQFALAKTYPEQFQLMVQNYLLFQPSSDNVAAAGTTLEPIFREIRDNLDNWAQLQNRKSYRKARQYVKTATRLALANSHDDLDTMEQLYSKAINLLPPSSPPLCEDHSKNKFGRCRDCDRRSILIKKLKSYACYKRALIRFEQQQYMKVLQDLDVLLRDQFDLSSEGSLILLADQIEDSQEDSGGAQPIDNYDDENDMTNPDYLGEPRTLSFDGNPYSLVGLTVLALKCFSKLNMVHQDINLDEVQQYLEQYEPSEDQNDQDQVEEKVANGDKRIEIIEAIANLVRYNANNCNFSAANTSLKFQCEADTQSTVATSAKQTAVTSVPTGTNKPDDSSENDLQDGDNDGGLQAKVTDNNVIKEVSAPDPDEVGYFKYLLDRRCKLCYDPNKGRYWIAGSTIPKGSIILVEKPYCLTVAKDYLTVNCNYCMLKLTETGGYTCDRCNEAVYCCVECMYQAYEQYHRYECGYLGLLLNISMTSSILYRVLTSVGVERALVYDRKFKPTSYSVEDYLGETQLRTKFKLSDSDRFSMYRMSTALIEHSDKYGSVMNAYHGMNAMEVSLILLVQYPKLMEIYEIQQQQRLDTLSSPITAITSTTDNILYDLFLLCVVQLRRIAVNIFGSYDHTDRGKHVVTNCEFLIGSLVNHSCDPNVEWVLENGHIVFKTKRDIKPNEELNITYGQTRVNPLDQRQEHLFNTYFFRCRCTLCKEDVIRTTDMLITSCQLCLTGPVIKAKSSAGCIDCGSSFPLEEIESIHQKVLKSEQLMNLYLKMVNFFDRDLNQKELISSRNICQPSSSPPTSMSQPKLKERTPKQLKTKNRKGHKCKKSHNSSGSSRQKQPEIKVCKKRYLTIPKDKSPSQVSRVQQPATSPVAKNDQNEPSLPDLATIDQNLQQTALGSLAAIEQCFEKYCYKKSKKFESRMQNLAKLYLLFGESEKAGKLAVNLFLKQLETEANGIEPEDSEDEWKLSHSQLERQLISYNFWTEICCRYCEQSIEQYGVVRDIQINKLTLLMFVKFLKLCCCYLQNRDNREKVRRAEQTDEEVINTTTAADTKRDSPNSPNSGGLSKSFRSSFRLLEHVDRKDFVEKCAFNEIKLIYILSEQKKAKLINILKHSNV